MHSSEHKQFFVSTRGKLWHRRYDILAASQKAHLNSFSQKTNKSLCEIYEYLRQTSAQCALLFRRSRKFDIQMCRRQKLFCRNARSSIHNLCCNFFMVFHHASAIKMQMRKTSICVHADAPTE
jgi:hypothetical protein